MKKRIIAYRTKIDELLKSNDEIDWGKVIHYYTLENEVQKMYVQYDEIRVRIFG